MKLRQTQTAGKLLSVSAIFCAALLGRPALVQAQNYITTVAGTGNYGFSGDGGPAAAAMMTFPFGIAVDASGNFFFADSDNNRIRRVDRASGLITTVAGNGVRGFSGDGGPATSASLDRPVRVTVDTTGNLFIADTYNQRIRSVDTNGIITTIAGNGMQGFGGDGDLATSASFNQPQGVAVDAFGNLFIADVNNHRIRQVDATSGMVTTVAGDGVADFGGDGGPATSAHLHSPSDVVVDGFGNILLSDSSNHRIRRVDGSSGNISTVVGNGMPGFGGDGGVPTAASLNNPSGIAQDGSGSTLFIADVGNNRIRRVRSGIITTVAGNGTFGSSGDGTPATSASLGGALGVAVDAFGDFFIADSFNCRIRRVDTTRIIDTAQSGLTSAKDVVLDRSGNLFIADTFAHVIRRMDAVSGELTIVAGTGSPGFGGDGGPATTAHLNQPLGVALDGDGNLFIGDTNNNRVRRVDVVTGIITTVAGTGMGGFFGDGGPATFARLSRPAGVVIDGAGNLFIADTINHRIRRVEPLNGIITTVAGNGTAGFGGDGGPATSASLNSPAGVALDTSGNLLIADSGNHRVRLVSGVITTIAGNGVGGIGGDGGPATSASLFFPQRVAVGQFGDLFIADTGNVRLRRVTAGIICTVVGNGSPGFSGDGGPATSARLRGPDSVAVDSSGNFWIADNGNQRIRMVFPVP